VSVHEDLEDQKNFRFHLQVRQDLLIAFPG